MNRRTISVKIGLFFRKITSITEFQGNNFLLTSFLTDFKIANLLLATITFKPWSMFVFQLLDQFDKFVEYDKNGDGSLDLTEVRNYLHCPKIRR